MKLYFAAGAREYIYLLLISGVKNILVSFAYLEPFKSKRILKRHGIKLMIDSGAFTAWTKGKKVKIDEYIKFIKDNNEIVDEDFIVNLDVIRGGKEDKATQFDFNESAKLGFQNWQYLKDRGIKSMPVFHQGENLMWLEKIIEQCDKVGISPNNDFTDEIKDKWLYECFLTIKRKQMLGKVWTHGFGITSAKLLFKYPFDSADSSAWALTSAFGSILTPHGRVTISKIKKEDPQYIENLPQHQRKEIIEYIESFGFSYKLATEDGKGYKYRNFINIEYFLQMEEKLNKEPVIFKDNQKQLFDMRKIDEKEHKKFQL